MNEFIHSFLASIVCIHREGGAYIYTEDVALFVVLYIFSRGKHKVPKHRATWSG